MWSSVSAFTVLLSLGLACVMAASAASASTLAHSYILSLDAETPEATRKEVVEALKRQGAKVGPAFGSRPPALWNSKLRLPFH